MTLESRLNAIKNAGKKQIPEAIATVMNRATEDLAKSGILENAPKVGDRLSAFALKDTEGTLYESEALLAKGPLVLSFYRGLW